jgi:dimethylpropiothetin dethiomethylase
MTKLNAHPDWLYLLRDFDNVYRRGSAGGSAIIRGHQRRVRDTLSLILKANPTLTPREPETKPVVDHLGRALDLASVGPLAGMARTIARLAGELTWEWGYERLGRDLGNRYAYCEFVGPRGPVAAESMIIGLVLFAPATTYPQPSHPEIEESYVSIGGAWSENDGAVYAPGSMILNRSGHEHRITVGDREPCLLAYAWIGPPARLANPDMKFSRHGRRG